MKKLLIFGIFLLHEGTIVLSKECGLKLKEDGPFIASDQCTMKKNESLDRIYFSEGVTSVSIRVNDGLPNAFEANLVDNNEVHITSLKDADYYDQELWNKSNVNEFTLTYYVDNDCTQNIPQKFGLTITIEDVNTHEPVFNLAGLDDLTLRIPYPLPAGISISSMFEKSITASDQDFSTKKLLTVTMDSNDYFVIEDNTNINTQEHTIKIKTAKYLETVEKMTLTLIANDNDPNSPKTAAVSLDVLPDLQHSKPIEPTFKDGLVTASFTDDHSQPIANIDLIGDYSQGTVVADADNPNFDAQVIASSEGTSSINVAMKIDNSEDYCTKSPDHVKLTVTYTLNEEESSRLNVQELGSEESSAHAYVYVTYEALCKPTDPTTTTNAPTIATDPTNPTDPTDPTNPTNPTDPTNPTNPTDPTVTKTVSNEATISTEPTVPTTESDDCMSLPEIKQENDELTDSKNAFMVSTITLAVVTALSLGLNGYGYVKYIRGKKSIKNKSSKPINTNNTDNENIEKHKSDTDTKSLNSLSVENEKDPIDDQKEKTESIKEENEKPTDSSQSNEVSKEEKKAIMEVKEDTDKKMPNTLKPEEERFRKRSMTFSENDDESREHREHEPSPALNEEDELTNF